MYENSFTKTLNGKNLANLLNVAPATLSGCMKKGHLCSGYDVQNWAETDINGRLVGYEVPFDVYEELSKKADIRPNQADNEPYLANSANSEPEKEPLEAVEPSEPVKKAIEAESISLLPKTQNYVEPVIAGSLGLLGKSVVENHTPNSRAVVFAGIAGVFAYLGYEFTDKQATGALLGALLGLGVTHLGYVSFSKGEALRSEIPDQAGNRAEPVNSYISDFVAENSFINENGALVVEPNLANSAGVFGMNKKPKFMS